MLKVFLVFKWHVSSGLTANTVWSQQASAIYTAAGHRPQMEPGTSREIPNGSGFPEPTGPREETPGEEARGGMLRRRGAEAEPAEEMEADCEDEPEHQRNTGGEEELDPRIQACYTVIIFTDIAIRDRLL